MSRSFPFKLFYVLFYLPAEMSLTMSRALLGGVFTSCKPYSKWTFQQVIATRLLKSILGHIATLRMAPRLSLEPGKEGTRFELIPPTASALYKGPMCDGEIKPAVTGGTWTTEPPDIAASEHAEKVLVLLHFHGGAYVVGDGRDDDTGFLAQTFLEETTFSHVFTPQYRLADTPSGRFPAALQDAFSAYVYLLKVRHVPASRIVIGGDSAGGNLALSLLRYLAEFGEELDVPSPAASVLWSPWSDVSAGLDIENIRRTLNYDTDFLHWAFAEWGTLGVTGGGRVSATDAYLSVSICDDFKGKVPMWVYTGKQELLYEDNCRLVELCRKCGVELEWEIGEDAPHDIILMGHKLGFKKEAREAARKAGHFVDRVRSA